MVRIKVAHKAQPTASLMFSPHFDDICDILMNKQKNVNGDINYKFVFLYIIGTNQTAYMMQLIA